MARQCCPGLGRKMTGMEHNAPPHSILEQQISRMIFQKRCRGYHVEDYFAFWYLELPMKCHKATLPRISGAISVDELTGRHVYMQLFPRSHEAILCFPILWSECNSTILCTPRTAPRELTTKPSIGIDGEEYFLSYSRIAVRRFSPVSQESLL